MRAFIAIDMPKEVKTRLGRIEEQLKTSGADAKWVEPANIHITLKFLGEIDEKTKESAVAAIKDTAEENAAFSMQLSSAGAFPDIKYPRIVWVGADAGSAETVKIAKSLEERLEKIGIPKEDREFACHITIARVRSGRNRLKLTEGIEKISAELKNECLRLQAGKITLFKSSLSPKGPVYEAVYEASLKTT
ncbi:MAG: RNA 2',3'-cyclic phosphodiesterase [Candidatus Omnitrophota bacterium]